MAWSTQTQMSQRNKMTIDQPLGGYSESALGRRHEHPQQRWLICLSDRRNCPGKVRSSHTRQRRDLTKTATGEVRPSRIQLFSLFAAFAALLLCDTPLHTALMCVNRKAQLRARLKRTSLPLPAIQRGEKAHSRSTKGPHGGGEHASTCTKDTTLLAIAGGTHLRWCARVVSVNAVNRTHQGYPRLSSGATSRYGESVLVSRNTP